MFKGAQTKRDWLERVGSYSTRPVLAAKVGTREARSFEVGRLADLLDERARLLRQLAHIPKGGDTSHVHRRLALVNPEIARLNREASDNREVELLWRAAREALPSEWFAQFSNRLKELKHSLEEGAA